MRRLEPVERCAVVAMLLLAWALRWVLLMESPPGWRDDDLIEVYTFSQRIVEQGPVLYFAGASGHEPLFHTLRAPLIALSGINQASARWLSAAAGTLTALLTWAVGRRTMSRQVGLVAAALVAVSFWGLMYSRVAIRHIGTVPWALLAVYSAWRLLRDRRYPMKATIGIAAGVAGAVLTYYAGRLVPILLVLIYPFLKPRGGRWRPYLITIAAGVALTLPMFWAAARTSGADARVSELAVPIHALIEGDADPLLRTAWTTLGMAHARGDPEWLYNISERPAFGAVGATLFYVALALTLWRWRRPQSRLLLIWLGAGIAPALISLPPSSYGHTILALPPTYLVLASLLDTSAKSRSNRRRGPRWIAALAILGVVALRDVPDYFADWSRASMVRFLYRADYRSLTAYLDDHAEIGNVSVGSMLFGPWDRIAVTTDLSRQDAHLRWFSPERALVFAGGEATLTFLQDEGQRAVHFESVLARSTTSAAPVGLHGYLIEPVFPPAQSIRATADGALLTDFAFGGSLMLQAVHLVPQPETDGRLEIVTWWKVTAPLPLLPEELIPYPPPPGVTNGPRLSVFAHLRAGDSLLAVDDGLWVDPYTLLPDDLVVQIHAFDTVWDDPRSLELTLGLYDPATGLRWTTPTGADSVTVMLTP